MFESEESNVGEHQQYLISNIFPILLPGLEKLLEQASHEKCFERKETKFQPLEFLTHYLYQHNPKYQNRKGILFEKIPFVEESFLQNPRKPLPKHLIWSEETAAIIIQSYFRGYLVRKQDHVQELRHYQKHLWEMQQKAISASTEEEEPIDKPPSEWDICLGYEFHYEISDSCSQEGVSMVTPFKKLREWEKYGEAITSDDPTDEDAKIIPKFRRTYPK